VPQAELSLPQAERQAPTAAGRGHGAAGERLGGGTAWLIRCIPAGVPAPDLDRSFHYLCKDADVDYWMNSDRPVILVCSHPSADEAWWVHVQPWFSDPAHRASRRIGRRYNGK